MGMTWHPVSIPFPYKFKLLRTGGKDNIKKEDKAAHQRQGMNIATPPTYFREYNRFNRCETGNEYSWQV
jgi:hypothetical protein